MSLPLADEYCSLDDVHRALISKLNVRLSQSRSGSDKNVLLKTSDTFVPTTVEHNITALVGNGVPAWIEMYDSGAEGYFPIRVVNLSQLAVYYDMGTLACSFWAEDTTALDGTAAVQYVTFTYLPSGRCRIRYDLDFVKDRLAQTSGLPEHVEDLIVKETENALIQQTIKPNLTLDLRGNEELRQDYAAIVKTLDDYYQQNVLDIQPLVKLWEIWAFRSADAQTSFTKPTPSGRGLYG